VKDLDWIQLSFLLLIITLITKPLGIYIHKVLNPDEKTFLDKLFKPLEKLTYRLCRIDAKKEQSWKEYLFCVLVFSGFSVLFTYVLLGCQQYLFLNPAKLGAVAADLRFNIAAGFQTNTDWQNYVGEKTLSYFSQIVPLSLQNFLSPAIGLSVAAGLVRGIGRHSSTVLGNFWVDITRITYYILLPLAFITAVFFVSQGVPQNFNPYAKVATLESGTEQMIVQGPFASQQAIKLIGTNGGGPTNANSAHPYENPSPLSNFVQLLCMLIIPAGQTYYLGREIKNQKHGWSLYIAMTLIFIVGVIICSTFEAKETPYFKDVGIAASSGNMEGKEQRFGIFGSTLFGTVTTSTSTGALNASHDSFTPIGGLIPMLNIQLGGTIWGGVGAGLYSILLFVIIAIFTAGLIIGRTPEYLGKKIEALDIQSAILGVLIFVFLVLGFTAWACTSEWGRAAIWNKGPHGFSEILYAYSSASGNNGSSFDGLITNTPWWNITLGCVMLIGRLALITFVLMLAGSLVKKKRPATDTVSFPVSGFTFTALVIAVMILVGALSFLPALIMGPFLEQFFMISGKLFK
jgi:K+-transporting ATPase ATPase A chain